MSGIFDAAIFDPAIFDTGATVVVSPSGGYGSSIGAGHAPSREDLRHALHFWDGLARREEAEQVIAKAATEYRVRDQRQQLEAAYQAQLGLLRAEFIALLDTETLRDEARRQFDALVAEEAERQDAQAAMMSLVMVFL